jgi:hypothetical protein
MYPIQGGWYHYATVHSSDCVYQYATGYIGPYTYNEMCGAFGGTCSALSTLTASAKPEFFVDALDSTPRSYESLDTPEEFKQFLKDKSPPGTTSGKYDTMTFTRPFASAYAKPICLRVNRTGGGVEEEIHAIVWQPGIAGTSARFPVYMGVEISGKPDGVALLRPHGVSAAVATQRTSSGSLTHAAMPGLLQVRFSKNSGGPKYDAIAFIRLHNSTKNRAASFDIHD